LLLEIAIGSGIRDQSRQVKLLDKLGSPLFPDGSRADHEQPPFALRPPLAKHDTGLDGLAEANFVRKDYALRKRGLERKHRGFDLMRIEINGSVEQGHGELIGRAGRSLPREIVREISGVIWRDHASQAQSRRRFTAIRR
jgi:hypothetical protein